MNYDEIGKQFLIDAQLKSCKVTPEHLGFIISSIKRDAHTDMTASGKSGASKTAALEATAIAKRLKELARDIKLYNETYRFSREFMPDAAGIDGVSDMLNDLHNKFIIDAKIKDTTLTNPDFIVRRCTIMFVDYFGLTPGKGSSGPFVRFVQALFKYAGLGEISGNTIKSAMTTYNKGQ